MSGVDIDYIISITDTVVDVSTTGIDLVGMVLTTNSLIPNNATQNVLAFNSATLVGDYFGTTSDEYLFATNYFLGASIMVNKPDFIWFARYINADVAPYIRSSTLASTALATIKAITEGELNVIFDSTTTTISSLDMSSISSFSDAALLIQTALQDDMPDATCTYDSTSAAFTITNGDDSGTSTVSYVTVTPLATAMQLTQSTGAVLSQGSVAVSPTDTMQTIVAFTRNWLSFTTLLNLSDDDTYTYTTALEFAKWASDQDNRYMYHLWSNETNLEIPGNTSQIAEVLHDAGYAAVSPQYNAYNHAAFCMGMLASIDYTVTNGTASMANKSQSGLAISCDSNTAYTSLIANGVNFYADFKAANDSFNFYQTGVVTGDYKWVDNFANKVWLADQIQISEAALMAASLKMDYGSTGQALLKSAISDVMVKALNNGVIQTGVTFDATTTALLKAQAGSDITSILTQNGYYLKLTIPTSSGRANRDPITTQIWYTNNGSFYSINNNLIFVA